MFEGIQNQSHLLTPYDSVKRERWRHNKLWISVIREEGRRLFERNGLPTLKLEEWKYTDVSLISELSFAAPTPTRKLATRPELLKSLLPTDLSPLRLVFVDGFFSPTLSRYPSDLPDGLEIGSLKEAIDNDHSLLQNSLSTFANPEENGFVALNTAFIEDGAWLHIPDGVRLDTPVHMIYLSTPHYKKEANEAETTVNPGVHPTVQYPRNLILVGSGADVSIIEEYIGETGNQYLTNAVTEIEVEDNARIEHYKLQRESENAFHVATIQVKQGNNSTFRSHNVTFGGSLTRNDINVFLTGEDSVCSLNGLQMLRDNQHVDNHTLIHHGVADCRSSELYHSILDDTSRCIFNGKIYVEPEAQKTDSRQTSRSLMLSNNAVVNAKPQLEIFADDVKCTHGATVGQLDADSLFYLRSRGISVEDAQRMITLGFAQQVTDEFNIESLKALVEQYIRERAGK
jgi:Fe-S cluster assembly protein SufD